VPSRHARQPQAPTGVTGPIATALYVKVAQNRARGKVGRHRKRWWPEPVRTDARS
jgi:hypothetical protein